MSSRRGAAWRAEQVAFRQLFALLELDELDMDAILDAIALCQLALAASETLQELEEVSAHAEVFVLCQRL